MSATLPVRKGHAACVLAQVPTGGHAGSRDVRSRWWNPGHPPSPVIAGQQDTDRSGAMFLGRRGGSTPAGMLCADRAPTESSGTRRPRKPCKRGFSKQSQTHPKQWQPPAPEAFTTTTSRRTAGRHAFLPNKAKLIRKNRNCRPQRQLRQLPHVEPLADIRLCRVALFLLRLPEGREVTFRPAGQAAGVASR